MTEAGKYAEEMIEKFINLGMPEDLAVKATILSLEHTLQFTQKFIEHSKLQKARNYLIGVGKNIRNN